MPDRLLYVDDEEPLRLLVKEQLSDEGFVVDTAEDGDDALQLLQQKEYDLVLLDIRMPRMDGMEVLEHMKKLKLRPRVIMLTALNDLTVAVRSLKLGANDYVTKPYSLPDLLASIRKVLAR